MDLYIVRHGNTFDKGDVVTRVGARTDLALSSSGHAQADALAAHFLAVLPEGFRTAYCSPLQRTKQTAETMLAVRENRPLLQTLEFLREVDYGPDENQPEERVIARIGKAALAAWDRDAVPPSGWDFDPDEIRRAWLDLFHLIGGDASSGPILIVTSNGIARFALDSVTEFKIQPGSIKLNTGAYGHLQITGDTVCLISWNVRP
ncbi:MAG: histidine phosphatase family protein [Pseudomonadota bacterium]